MYILILSGVYFAGYFSSGITVQMPIVLANAYCNTSDTAEHLSVDWINKF